MLREPPSVSSDKPVLSNQVTVRSRRFTVHFWLNTDVLRSVLFTVRYKSIPVHFNSSIVRRRTNTGPFRWVTIQLWAAAVCYMSASVRCKTAINNIEQVWGVHNPYLHVVDQLLPIIYCMYRIISFRLLIGSPTSRLRSRNVTVPVLWLSG